MPRSTQEIIDHADELAAQFEAYEPRPEDERDPAPWRAMIVAVEARGAAEAAVTAAVADMRAARYSWALIGSLLGTTGSAAHERYAQHLPTAGR